MANNGKNSVTKAQAEAHRRTLSQLLRHDDNRRCADCLARGPTWASVNLGVFVCLNCSGVHRSLGTDLSKVRSTTLDTWLPEQVAFVQRMGNRKANLFWEGALPRTFKRPAEGDMLGLRHFINDKYRDQLYALKTWDKPPTIETYLVHPFMKQTGSVAMDQPCAADAAEQPSGGNSLDSTSRRLYAASPDARGPESAGACRRLGSIGDAGNLKPLEAQSLRLGSTQRRTGSPSLNPPPKPAAAPPPTPELFDLLSLNEAESAPSPSVQDLLLPSSDSSVPQTTAHRHGLSQESFADTASSDGGWAAFVGGSTAASSAAPADDTWDAFQGGAAERESSQPSSLPDGGAAAAPASQNAAFQPKFPSAPSSPTPAQKSPQAKKGGHRPQKSAEEIMRMFDQPKQQPDNLFSATFPMQPPTQAGSLPGSFLGSTPGVDAGVASNLWPPFQMPLGVPSHNDLTFPPQMFNIPAGGMPPFPDMSSPQGGWATLPPTSKSSFGGSGGNPSPGKGIL